MLNLSSQKILVTGAHGFLGQHLIENLVNQRKVDKKQIKTPRSKELDLRKWEDCQQAVSGVDLVIHLAASVGGIGANRRHPGKFFYDNIIMGTQLIEASRIKGVKKFVSVGTICSYPKFTPVPFKESDLWKGYPEETNAPYGLAKKMLIVQAQAYKQEYDFNAISLLPVNMYGPNDNFDPESSHVIPALIKKIYDAKTKNSPHITVWGTGSATREFMFVKDGAEGIILATEKYNKQEPVNLGAGFEISIKSLVFLLKELMQYKGKIVWDHSKPDGQPRRSLNTTKATKEFGYTAKTKLEDGLKQTIDYYHSLFR